MYEGAITNIGLYLLPSSFFLRYEVSTALVYSALDTVATTLASLPVNL